MKRISIFTVLLLMLLGCTGGKTVFEGKIIGYKGEFTEFFLIDPQSGEFYEMPLEINEDGTFSLELELKRNEYDAPLFVDRFMFRTCVEQGKKYTAEFDVTKEGVETEFRFIGEGAAENEFTRDFWNGFGTDYGFMAIPREVQDFKSYKESVDADVKEFTDRLESIGNEGFSEFYSAALKERQSKYSIYYPYLYLAANGNVLQDADYTAYLQSNPFEGMSDEAIGKQLNAMAGTVLVNGSETDMVKTLEIASALSAEKMWNDVFMTAILLNYMQFYGADGIDDAYKFYRSIVTDPAYYSQVEKPYESGRLLAKGAAAPEIELADLNGNKINLSDLKGKALYIDFWASWCKPCCEEIPYFQKIVNELGNDKEITCISISIDEDERSWKKRLDSEKPSWSQYIATPEGLKTISETYQINSIPRFVLVDKNGCILDINAPRPSELNAKKLKGLL